MTQASGAHRRYFVLQKQSLSLLQTLMTCGTSAEDCLSDDLTSNQLCFSFPLDYCKGLKEKPVVAVQGPSSWLGKYYKYCVRVYSPWSRKIETLEATDPYSRSLAADGARSQVSLIRQMLPSHSTVRARNFSQSFLLLHAFVAAVYYTL